MPNTDPIPPAVSEAEWASRMVAGAGDWFWIRIGDWLSRLIYTKHRPAAAHAIVALANAALPDDDPRRITAVDVEALKRATDERYDPDVDPPREALLQLAAKLAALLPPDEG